VLRRVKQEKADVGEQLADKEELCGQVVLGEHRKNVTIDRLKARLREAGVDEHEIFGLVSLGIRRERGCGLVLLRVALELERANCSRPQRAQLCISDTTNRNRCCCLAANCNHMPACSVTILLP
jgi:hypothetical protein